MRRKCLDCPARIESGSRCASCERAKNAPRAAYKADRYGADYRRVSYALKLKARVQGFTCARGGEYHPPGSPSDCDHIDGTLALSCPAHNRGAGT